MFSTKELSTEARETLLAENLKFDLYRLKQKTESLLASATSVFPTPQTYLPIYMGIELLRRSDDRQKQEKALLSV
jgi:hypothetical protein